MKKVLLGGVVHVTLGLVGSALAADMPVKAPVPVNTWTGVYIGVDIGGIRGFNSTDSFRETGDNNNPGCINGCFDPVAFQQSNWGVSAGAHGGYNWQLDPSFVVGVEADFSKTSLSNNESLLFLTFNGLPVPPCNLATPGTCHGLLMGQDLNWTATARARAGYTIGSMMAYVTGGVAIESHELTGQVAAAAFNTFTVTRSQNFTDTGWVAGGGLEFMATANWILRLEYLHYAFSSGRTLSVPCSACGPGAFAGTGNFTWNNSSLDLIRIGLSYKFGPSATVMMGTESVE
jgi:outer membrane immunogenic protein